MPLTGPEPLSERHILTGFDSGQPALDSWLVSRALRNERSGASRTYVACEDGRAIAYYCLSAASAAHRAVPGRIRRNMPDPVPVVLLGRLAVARSHQGRGLARDLVRDATLRTLRAAEIAGVRALLVHAADASAAGFYRKVGFIESPTDPLVLLLPLETMRNGFDT
ncbi:MAG: GNAT family N-acetyltransferase [Rhodospirillaceae bacterium]|nr:GNAT family N-acetyltransferase [Rhodospirillaceae bacterium]MCY4064900.1 GNAT family N-acetyltransferase [Rhodospirillaceae bacterium]MDE0703106.1 GNAT family N-acetyltransferase [Rhodospirillaceae bacterium]MYG51853.1 GNAT family N-acetyltransferase [Rhodospirillaceae bacterium]